MGKYNHLPWHLPADLNNFKNLTSGHPIIMGRKTYDSFGKPLPKRQNILFPRQEDLTVEGADVVNSLEEALQLVNDKEEIFVIGGAEIFRQSIAEAEVLYLTRIHEVFEADTFFPEINADEWLETDKITHQPDEKNHFSYTFITYRKR